MVKLALTSLHIGQGSATSPVHRSRRARLSEEVWRLRSERRQRWCCTREAHTTCPVLPYVVTFGSLPLPDARADSQIAERVEILPVRLKVDYKPKRVDFNALRSGKLAELMNFFHFEGSEMTLRHLNVAGVRDAAHTSSPPFERYR